VEGIVKPVCLGFSGFLYSWDSCARLRLFCRSVFLVGQEVVRFCCSHEFRISEGFGILNWDAVILISTPTIRLDHKCVCASCAFVTLSGFSKHKLQI